MSSNLVFCALLVSVGISGCAVTDPSPRSVRRVARHSSRLEIVWIAADRRAADDSRGAVSRGAVQAVEIEQDDESDDFDDFDEFDEFDEEIELRGEVFDPISGFNRGIFYFNDKVYLWVWEPAAKGYRFIVPQAARVAINNGYKNFNTPPRFLNACLQLKGTKAGVEMGRFVVNSTVGILGLFDAADYFFELRAPSPEDFGQTLGHYGIGGGFPIVLPLLGPSNLRDGIGRVADSFAQPVTYFVAYWATVGLTAGDEFNYSSLHIGEYESLKSDALDPYTLFRDAYQQRREKQIQE
jgi:phospholipid-binding lipoprotein MlaA